MRLAQAAAPPIYGCMSDLKHNAFVKRHALSHKIDDFPEGVTNGALVHLPQTVWAFIWFFLRQIKGRFYLLVFLGLLGGLLGNLAPYFFGRMIDVFINTENKDDLWGALAMPFGLYVALVLVASPIIFNMQGWFNSVSMP